MKREENKKKRIFRSSPLYSVPTRFILCIYTWIPLQYRPFINENLYSHELFSNAEKKAPTVTTTTNFIHCVCDVVYYNSQRMKRSQTLFLH